MVMRLLVSLGFVANLVLGASLAAAEDRFLVLASTTSTDNSGLFGEILPKFQKESGINVRVVAVGTGQALKLGRNGDADVLLVHDRAAEDAFVEEGFGVARYPVMYNDFVVVGPDPDPAGVAGLDDVAEALRHIAQSQSIFVSRGDDSGTHRKELALWQDAGMDATAASGEWYRETGSGMGASLNTAQGLGAYILVDRATWTAFGNKAGLKLLVQGDERLFNPYGVILINPQRHPHVRATEGQAFIDWLVSDTGQDAIRAFQIDGTQLFFPNAKPPAVN